MCNWTSWTTLNRSLNSARSSLSFPLPPYSYIFPSQSCQLSSLSVWTIFHHMLGKMTSILSIIIILLGNTTSFTQHVSFTFYSAFHQERLIHSSILKSRKYLPVWLWLNIHDRTNQTCLGEGSDKNMAIRDPFLFNVEPFPEKGKSLWERLTQDHCHHLGIWVILVPLPSWN